jgi:hypothetical protein
MEMDDGAAQPQVVADGVQEPLRDRADLLVALPVGLAHARLLELFELGVEVGAPRPSRSMRSTRPTMRWSSSL